MAEKALPKGRYRLGLCSHCRMLGHGMMADGPTAALVLLELTSQQLLHARTGRSHPSGVGYTVLPRFHDTAVKEMPGPVYSELPRASALAWLVHSMGGRAWAR